MGIFSKLAEHSVDLRERKRGIYIQNGPSSAADGSFTHSEKGLIEYVREMLQSSGHNAKQEVLRYLSFVTNDDAGSLPLASAMEEPFCQSDSILISPVENNIGSSFVDTGHEDAAQKTGPENLKDNLVRNAPTIRDVVLDHWVESNKNYSAQASSPIEHGNNEREGISDVMEDHGRTIVEAMSKSVQVDRGVIGNQTDVFESSPTNLRSPGHDEPRNANVNDGEDRKQTLTDTVTEVLTRSVATVKSGVLKHVADRENMQDLHLSGSDQEFNSVVKHKDEGVGLLENVKEVAHEIKEEVIEAMQEVKDAVLIETSLHNLSGSPSF